MLGIILSYTMLEVLLFSQICDCRICDCRFCQTSNSYMSEVIENMNDVLVLMIFSISRSSFRISYDLIFVKKIDEIAPTDMVAMFG
jgi:hypothetical protein